MRACKTRAQCPDAIDVSECNITFWLGLPSCERDDQDEPRCIRSPSSLVKDVPTDVVLDMMPEVARGLLPQHREKG